MAAGLRWGDLLNTAPNTLVSVRECLVRFAANAKNTGASEVRSRGSCNFSSPNAKWLCGWYTLSTQHSGNIDRDFWDGRPSFFETANGFFNQAPPFRRNVKKRMTILLERANYMGERSIRRRSLKVAAISSIMAEIEKM